MDNRHSAPAITTSKRVTINIDTTMTKDRKTVLIPQKDYDRALRYNQIAWDYAEMKEKEPTKSNNAIYTQLGAKYDTSISVIRTALDNYNGEVTAVTPL